VTPLMATSAAPLQVARSVAGPHVVSQVLGTGSIQRSWRLPIYLESLTIANTSKVTRRTVFERDCISSERFHIQSANEPQSSGVENIQIRGEAVSVKSSRGQTTMPAVTLLQSCSVARGKSWHLTLHDKQVTNTQEEPRTYMHYANSEHASVVQSLHSCYRSPMP
jgi:hypothetical protein